MTPDPYLEKGLCGLARAHPLNPMAGHLGAALVAGALMREETLDLHPDVRKALARDMDRIATGEESVWYDVERSGTPVRALFSPAPRDGAEPVAHAVGTLAEALLPTLSELHQSGHNVIFAALAMRALALHPDAASPFVVTGIATLIQRFSRSSGGRGYYGRQMTWLSAEDAPKPDPELVPDYASPGDMADAVIRELIVSASTHRRGYGGLFHIINHAAGLVDLATCGCEQAAVRGVPAHRLHLALWRGLPNVEAEFGRLVAADRDPSEPEYWTRRESVQWAGWLTHRIKTLYGFGRIVPLVRDEGLRSDARKALRYLMA